MEQQTLDKSCFCSICPGEVLGERMCLISVYMGICNMQEQQMNRGNVEPHEKL